MHGRAAPRRRASRGEPEWRPRRAGRGSTVFRRWQSERSHAFLPSAFVAALLFRRLLIQAPALTYFETHFPLPVKRADLTRWHLELVDDLSQVAACLEHPEDRGCELPFVQRPEAHASWRDPLDFLAVEVVHAVLAAHRMKTAAL